MKTQPFQSSNAPPQIPAEEVFSLTKALDSSSFTEVCRSFGELFGIGIKVFASDFTKITDVRASNGDHCGYLFSVHPTRVLCTKLVSHIQRFELDDTTSIHTIGCFSGLQYKIAPICYEGSVLGRLIVGPFAPLELQTPPAELKQYEPGLNLQKLGTFLQGIPHVDNDTIEQVVRHVLAVLDVLIHSSHTTFLTSHVHLSSMTSSFTDLQKVNQELSGANEQLKELDRMKSNFVATVSHELRTPLTSIIGYTEMLLEGRGGTLSQEQREHLQTILEKSESLLGIIGQILDLSRIESGNMLVHKTSVDLRELIERSLSDVTPQAHKKNIQLRTEWLMEAPPIIIDTDKIRRVITNLLSNAVKFTPPGGTVKVQLDVTEMPPGENKDFDIFEPERNCHVRIRVIDTGVGIPPDKLDRIFDSFYQVSLHGSPELGGTGLGLTIVRNFLRAHDGRISVQSVPGTGSTFTVLLPYVTNDVTTSVGPEVFASMAMP